MSKTEFCLIGSGWRAEFYIRIAKALPEQFSLQAVLIRDAEKGRQFSERFGVKVVHSLEALLAEKPDFIVLAIKRGVVTNYLLRLFETGVPVLTETPPGESLEDLQRLWDGFLRFQPKVQVAEQYFLQPLYAAWHRAIEEELLGNVTNISLSALHGYHGMSMIRWMLGIRGERCTMYGKRYYFPVTETYGREGMVFDGKTFICPRDHVTIEFENGKTAFFDFSDPAQYHSFIRTRQLNIQGERGEIDDLTIRYLTKDHMPVTQSLNRIDLGVYGNQEWSHYGLMLGEQFLYRTPFVNARLNDDELAVGTLLLRMKEYLQTGKNCYCLADALQDMYLCLTMEKAMKREYQPVTTELQPWQQALD